MARIKGAMNARKKHKKVLKMAKGFVGARSKQYRIAKQSVMRAMAHNLLCALWHTLLLVENKLKENIEDFG